MSVTSVSSTSNYFDMALSLTKAKKSSASSQDDLASKIDANGDGKITKAEVQTWADDMKKNAGISIDVDKMFSTYDTDNDGTLTTDQLKSALDAQRPSAAQGKPPAPPSSADLAKKIDSNGDGKITKTELQAWADDMEKNAGISVDVDKMFSTYDTANNGYLTTDQLSTALDAQRKADQATASAYGTTSQINLLDTQA